MIVLFILGTLTRRSFRNNSETTRDIPKNFSPDDLFLQDEQINGKTRESNRLKYRSGSGSGSRNFIFYGSVPVQVQDFSKIWVQVRFGFSCTKI